MADRKPGRHPSRLEAVEAADGCLDKKAYRKKLAKLQLTMVRAQQAIRREGKRLIVVFEGGDAAGKGGTIRRFVAPLDPRGVRVWSIGKPRPDEQGRHYLYRFWRRLPAPGEIAVFDRSWYGRVLVERVEGLAAAKEWRRAYREINKFERLLVDDGVLLVKLYLHVSADEQLKRFCHRLADPAKRWKMTPEDIRNRAHWADYRTAIEEMLERTSTREAPWRLLCADEKRFLRIAALEEVVGRVRRRLDLEPPGIDPELPRAVVHYLGASMLERLGLAVSSK